MIMNSTNEINLISHQQIFQCSLQKTKIQKIFIHLHIEKTKLNSNQNQRFAQNDFDTKTYRDHKNNPYIFHY